MTRTKRVAYGLCAILLFSTLVGSANAFRQGNWMYIAQSTGAAFGLLLPFLMEIRKKLIVPDMTKIVLILFVYCAQFLGSVNDFYDQFAWWDSAMHFLSGPATGLLGYSIARQMRARPNGTSGMGPGVTLLLVFSFVMTVGAFWEITEFAIDQGLGQNMQLGSLSDTMYDSLFNTLGAVLVTWLAHLQLKGKIRFMDQLAIRSTAQETGQLD